MHAHEREREREREGLCVCVCANTTIIHRVYTCTSSYVSVSKNSTQTFEQHMNNISICSRE